MLRSLTGVNAFGFGLSWENTDKAKKNKLDKVEYSCDSALIGRWKGIDTNDAQMFAGRTLVLKSDATGVLLDTTGGQTLFRWNTDVGQINFDFDTPVIGYDRSYNYETNGISLTLSAPDAETEIKGVFFQVN